MRDNIYTADMGQPPMEPDGGSAPPPPRRLAPKRAAKPPMKPSRRAVPPEAGAGDVTPPAGAPGMPGGPPLTKMKKGGSVSSRADGVAKRGRTNCKMY